MSPRNPSRARSRPSAQAALFAALGDKTRLALVVRLSSGQPASISQLTAQTRVTRQAVTKHLRALERVGLVHSTRLGRESLFELNAHPFEDMQEYLSFVSEKWDQALARLKNFVEV